LGSRKILKQKDEKRGVKMFDKKALAEIEKRRKEWEEKTLNPQLKKFGTTQTPNEYYTPLDIKDHDFAKDVGFPGEYPFTAGKYPTQVPGSGPVKGGGHQVGGGGLVRAGRYSGYGTAPDTRDYYKMMIARGATGGPNLAFDLPTQVGLDSDDPRAEGEVGGTGVCVDSLKDFETIYEAFTGNMDLDKIHSAWTINPMANVMVAMYCALAEKRGIPLNKLRCTPQNDILKEVVARGTHIFPLRHGMRMTRDTLQFSVSDMPGMNPVSIGGHHHREAGANRIQVLAFHLADGIAYLQLSLDAGLNVDDVAPRFTFLEMSGSLELFKEVALHRAARRMWGKIVRDRFGAKNPRSWLYRDIGGGMTGFDSATKARPLNNLTRTVIGGMAEALSGYIPTCEPPFDEALGLGHSLEAMQLQEDAARIIMYEARLCDVTDPLAGSYYVEWLTDQAEKEAWEIVHKIDRMGGMVAAIESGWVDAEIARSAYEDQQKIEMGERVIVGVNRFVGEHEIEVNISRSVPHPYDPVKREKAEELAIANLKELRKNRDNGVVKAGLKRLKEVAEDEKANTIPVLIEAVKAYATVGEIAGTLKDVFGTYQEPEL
jgi:methylmalonyl-CoA mutase N-terminal domain/subunit